MPLSKSYLYEEQNFTEPKNLPNHSVMSLVYVSFRGDVTMRERFCDIYRCFIWIRVE